jgi:hypothetical protein
MSIRTSRWIARSAWVLSVALAAFSVPLFVANRSIENGMEPYMVNLLVAALAFSTVGALIASRRRENPIGWLLLGTGILYAIEIFTGNYSVYALFTEPGSLPGGVVAAWLTSWVWISGGSLVLFVFLFFPDGRLPSRRWRPVAWLVLINAALSIAPYAFGPGVLRDFPEELPVVNPVGIEGSAGVLDLFARISLLLLVPISLSLVFAFYLRFRRARGDERQQIKWVAYAVALFAAAIIVVSVWPSLDGSVLGGVLFMAGFLAIPSAMALAILRYRLYDIDVIVNRTLVYGALTLLLALIYFGGVVALQYVFRTLTGGESQLAVVASTLVIAALFNPLRHRIQGFIDHRFYRRKYDAERVLATFSGKLRGEADLDRLSEDLLVLVRETVQPEHVSLWLRAPSDVKGRA